MMSRKSDPNRLHNILNLSSLLDMYQKRNVKKNYLENCSK